MALWRDADPETFRATIIAAAERIGIQPLAVEKDYWVCEALRAIVTAHRGEVVFKSGTSLEKMRIIQRFSEDLDLLVVGDYPSTRSAKRALRAMIETAASATGSQVEPMRFGGTAGTLHRSAYLTLPLEQSETAVGLADPGAILIELGQSGGPNPSRTQAVESLLSRELADSGVGEWDDLAAFDVTVLHPGRTLIEKLLRVNNFVSDAPRRDGTHGLARIGRQFCDIWALLVEPEFVELLSDKRQFNEILGSAFAVSEAFTPDHPVPAGGFASSVAFDPHGEFAAGLQREHERAMHDLYYGRAPGPSFDDVLGRVRANAELLNPES